ncbi:guanitoxin biosynthesis L-enduracididine beta-hydroxylase GntD [Nonomuraea sp. NPDC049758]|uniref:guanitoxin biosynthesis L-enduracididine beta-hydroxylase GntD n=1 Tax=Nonomuraea sp. NPDC049758 TaxID=3154360 RepID=UPI003441A7C8
MSHARGDSDGILRIRLAEPDLGHLDELLTEMERRAGSGSAEQLVEIAHDLARRLPPALQGPLDSMRLWESPVGLVMSGYQVDDRGIGPTPTSWHHAAAQPREELLLLLLTAPLGQPYAWRTQQGGQLVHDILPTQGDEHVQLGSSSTTELLWHTEDAFHESRCDYLGLLCLRNDDGVSTTVSVPDVTLLPPRIRAVLAEPLFHILPDDSHLSTRNPDSSDDAERAGHFTDIQRRVTDPPPTPVLFGPEERPYLRIDPAYMTPMPGSASATEALREVCALIDGSLREVVLGAGDVLVLDNFRAVHGRRPFHARYDGRDRWLKRVSVTRDLRRQRMAARTVTGLAV